MLVLLDLEWLSKNGRLCPTQVGAVIVDGDWNIVDHFFTRIRPLAPSFYDGDHFAFTGGSKNDFLNAPTAVTVFSQLRDWLPEDSVIAVWDTPNVRMWRFITSVILKDPQAPKAICILDHLPLVSQDPYRVHRSPEILARKNGIQCPSMEHNAQADAVSAALVLQALRLPQTALLEAPPKLTPPNPVRYCYDPTTFVFHRTDCPEIADHASELRQLKKIDPAIQNGYTPCNCAKADVRQAVRAKRLVSVHRAAYIYVYSDHSFCFHRFDCPRVGDISTKHMCGGMQYDRIIEKGLKPCSICHPSPTDFLLPHAPLSPALTRLRKKHSTKGSSSSDFPSMSRATRNAIMRWRNARLARSKGLQGTLTEQQRADLYTLTQPRYGFFSAVGYRSFHLPDCPKLSKMSQIRGYELYSHARHAGLSPCKVCHPTAAHNVTVSIPLANQRCENESPQDLIPRCESAGFSFCLENEIFHISTSVGKWAILTNTSPIQVMHINLVQTPDATEYHKQHRLFLSLTDTFTYIKRHDETLAYRITPTRRRYRVLKKL